MDEFVAVPPDEAFVEHRHVFPLHDEVRFIRVSVLNLAICTCKVSSWTDPQALFSSCPVEKNKQLVQIRFCRFFHALASVEV